MAYNKINSVSFDSLDKMAEILFSNQKSKSQEQIKLQIADFLMENGNKKFVEIYNEIQLTKDYKKALETFKI